MSVAPRNPPRLGDYLQPEAEERVAASSGLSQRPAYGIYSMDTGASESMIVENGAGVADQPRRQISLTARQQQAAPVAGPVQSYASAPLASGISMGRPVDRSAAPSARLGVGRGNVVYGSRPPPGGVFNFNRPDAYANDEQWASDLSIIGAQ